VRSRAEKNSLTLTLKTDSNKMLATEEEVPLSMDLSESTRQSDVNVNAGR
jgi:hypothetical protein